MHEYYSQVHFQELTASWADRDSASLLCLSLLTKWHCKGSAMQRVWGCIGRDGEEMDRAHVGFFTGATLGGSTITLVSSQTSLTCRYFEPPVLQTTPGLDTHTHSHPPVMGCWSGPNKGKQWRAGRQKKEKHLQSLCPSPLPGKQLLLKPSKPNSTKAFKQPTEL